MKKAVSFLVGVLAALAVGELAASHRDRGGFPHFNGYIADSALGVRLERDYDTKIAYGDNPVSAIHINHQGYRGADWPEGRTGEIAVIGDSQVFGLGVDDDQTASAVLAGLTKRPVINVGVPTYGSDEYLAMIDEVAPRKPSDIVVVINFANDLFELGHPNRSRHVVLDGWAIRGSAVPDHWSFPGRSWLFQRSHLIYAARGLLHTDDVSAGAEGTDLQVPEAPPPRPVSLTQTQVSDQVMSAVSARDVAEAAVIGELTGLDPTSNVPAWDAALEALRQGAQEGDITDRALGEESEVRVEVTAGWLKSAAQLRDSAPGRLKAWIAAHPGDPHATEAQDALDKLDQARAAMTALGGLVANDGERASAFRGFLIEATKRAAKAGATLTVVALPMDVQVEAREFEKYGQKPQNLLMTMQLLWDLCQDAAHLGERCLAPTEALREAEPGAFLDGDLHMSPTGQAAFAKALADTLATAPRRGTPMPGLPAGRTRFPTEEEWWAAENVAVTGAVQNHCHTQVLREYLRVDCKSRPTGITKAPALAPDAKGPVDLPFDATPVYGAHLLGLRVVDGPQDRQTDVREDEARFVLPMLPDRPISVDFYWTDRVERLVIPPRTATADQPIGAFQPQSKTDPPASWADPYRGAKTCPEGRISSGASGRCLALCNDATPCAEGQCTDWQGFGLCL